MTSDGKSAQSLGASNINMVAEPLNDLCPQDALNNTLKYPG